jgi:uncharacterized membrane protein (GlpM family)
MRIRANLRAIRSIQWHEYAIRFIFGGAITVLAGAVANTFGPAVGGLFLAFPAILPATITLIEKHTSRSRSGSKKPGRRAAAFDAAGTVMGSIALLTFALLLWTLLPRMPSWLALAAATLAWAVSAFVIWTRCRRWVLARSAAPPADG